MNKIYIICLSCGKVQLRTDIMEELNDKYIVLANKLMCPRCNHETVQAATKDIKTLSKKLDINNSKDRRIFNLIKR